MENNARGTRKQKLHDKTATIQVPWAYSLYIYVCVFVVHEFFFSSHSEALSPLFFCSPIFYDYSFLFCH